LIPRSLRHELGEYYTPDWLADHVLDQLGYAGDPEQRVLDPACGSGTFLLRAIGRVRARGDATTRLPALDEETLCQKILANVVGYELSPVAVLAARANYLIALGDLVRHVGPVSIPVVLCDSILDGPPSDGPSDVARPGARFDLVMGNPPWIAWDNLPADYRQATKPLWQHYGLFSLGASEARHGGAKKDLSMLMAYVAADRYLKQGGRMGLVITQTLFQTKGAGEGFRRFRLGPTGDGLRVLRVDDLAATNPFPGAASRTSTIVLEKGLPTQYPVPYVQWLKDGRRRTYLAQPVEPERAGSPWFLRPDGFDVPLERLIGPSDYTAHLGANSGGANGVYWVTVLGEAEGGVRVRNLAEKNRRSLESVEQVIEPDLLYPLLCWGDVARYRAVPSAAILLAQDVQSRSGIDPAVMGCRYPRTLAYLERFQGLLTARAAYRRYQGGKAFYSMYNVGPYTVAPIKVVWRRMDRRIRAAVVEEAAAGGLGCRPVVPQETCVLIAVDSVVEAHYLCAVLNSAVVHFLVASHSIGGGKGFGTPGILDFVRLKRFDAADGRHRELAVLSQEAHRTLAESRVGQAMRRPTRESESGNRACTRGSALRLTHPTIPPHGEAAGGASQTGQPSICALSDAIVKAATEAPPMPRFARPTLQSGAMIDLQGRIDRLAAALWDLTPGQGEAIASLSETASPSE
jgi:SAM-dependent methyltransferase